MLNGKRLKWGMVVVVLAAGGATLVGVAQREASAGDKVTINVSIDTSQRTAYGTLGSARNSSSGIENIGCTIWSAPPWDEVTCAAKMSGSGTPSASCSSFDPQLVAAARAISGDSYVRFYWDSAGDCTEITVAQYSKYPPKAP